MTYYDENGFQVLIPKKSVDQQVDTRKKKEKRLKLIKDIKNPFKKGSWKYNLFKHLKKFRISKFIEDFHFVKLENILIYRKDDPKAIISKTRFSQKDLEKISNKYEDAFILVNASCNTYIKISLKSYMKLMKIQRLAVDYKVNVMEDGDDEFFEYYSHSVLIDNINDLMDFINYYRQLVNGIGDVQACVCCYSWIEFKVKTLVVFNDGTTETYKGDFNEFLKDFNISPLI